jgi:hypothetical protein
MSASTSGTRKCLIRFWARKNHYAQAAQVSKTCAAAADF